MYSSGFDRDKGIRKASVTPENVRGNADSADVHQQLTAPVEQAFSLHRRKRQFACQRGYNTGDMAPEA